MGSARQALGREDDAHSPALVSSPCTEQESRAGRQVPEDSLQPGAWREPCPRTKGALSPFLQQGRGTCCLPLGRLMSGGHPHAANWGGFCFTTSAQDTFLQKLEEMPALEVCA